jgi:hypothetical protein
VAFLFWIYFVARAPPARILSALFLLATADAARPKRSPHPNCGANPVHLLVFHDRGKGSHALADRLDNLGCVHFLRGEHLHLHPAVLAAFFRSPTATWASDVLRAITAHNQTVDWKGGAQGLGVEIRALAAADTRQRCACVSRGTLVRLDMLDGSFKNSCSQWSASQVARAARGLCPLFKPADGCAPGKNKIGASPPPATILFLHLPCLPFPIAHSFPQARLSSSTAHHFLLRRGLGFAGLRTPGGPA